MRTMKTPTSMVIADSMPTITILLVTLMLIMMQEATEMTTEVAMAKAITMIVMMER